MPQGERFIKRLKKNKVWRMTKRNKHQRKEKTTKKRQKIKIKKDKIDKKEISNC